MNTCTVKKIYEQRKLYLKISSKDLKEPQKMSKKKKQENMKWKGIYKK
jgi:hypothetical protein